MNLRRIGLATVLLGASLALAAQEKPPYQWPEQAPVRETLTAWQDLKFGLFLHWGTYSQWGIVESWSLLPEHIEICYKPRPDSLSYFEYVQAYERLQTTFNPTLFDPDAWAQEAQQAGMKYVVFTTKHHDGFNMFDTQQSPYKITDALCPFHTHPKANVAQEVFRAFNEKGFMTGAYFSIPDWHHNDFWWDKFPPLGKGINYPAAKFPEKLAAYHDFVDNQLAELSDGTYGPLDIFWFDLCYTEPTMPWDRLEATIRQNLPGALMVARHQNTKYENYRTPEQTVPTQALDYPWESCITMGTSWSYKPNDTYKSTAKLLETLVKIISRGGNLLLNIGPDANGQLPAQAVDRLHEIGRWMDVNQEAVYGTRSFAPYSERQCYFTQKQEKVFAFYVPSGQETTLPKLLSIDCLQPARGTKVFLLGEDKPLQWEYNGRGVVVHVPERLRNAPPCEHIWCFQFTL